jgi:methylase of polypeptide subunit release factors
MIQRATFRVDDADAPALREAVSNIARIGYSEKGVRERLGLDDITELIWRALPAYREERLASRDPLALAIDLFLLQGSLPNDELVRLLSPSDRDVLIRAGVLTIDEGRARARASLFPVGDRLIFSDQAWPELAYPRNTTVPHDQVMFVGLDSRHLARCTSRRGIGSALDLCTGSGIQALLASAHSQRVLAVDVNPRAADCARFNAQALGITNLEVAIGDLFAPADGQRFDLITANPPFVPSPVNALQFRDGGLTGEDIQKRIVAGLPQHLAPGGIAQIITELGEREKEPLVHRLREWLGAAPMDIHILRLREHSAIKYAIGHAKGEDYDEFLESVHAWSSNLRAQGFVRVISLLISFKWSDPACGAPWERIEQSEPPKCAAGTEIEAAFVAERLSRQPDLGENLKRNWLRLAGPIALLEARVMGSDIPANAKATRLGQALTIEYQLDAVEKEVLRRIEGHSTGADIGEQAVMEAVRSLLRKRLICLDASERADS